MAAQFVIVIVIFAITFQSSFPYLFLMKVEMPDPATLYASTDVNSMAAPFVPGPALYVEPTLNQQVLFLHHAGDILIETLLVLSSAHKDERFQDEYENHF